MFWLASRSEQAIVWSQAGGSLNTDSAGVWWSSMSLDERTNYLAFVENQKLIESEWDKNFGDRKNELVFIGQDMDEELIKSQLNFCLSTEKEIESKRWKAVFEDAWPINRINSIQIQLLELLKSKEISEDDEKKFEKTVQTFTDDHIKAIDQKVETKEKEIMTI